MKLKRILALLLSLIFIISVNVTGFAAEEEGPTFDPSMYYETISLLSTLGVIDSNFYAEGTPDVVTRGEFAQAAAKILNIAPLTSFVADFADVPSEHSYASYIYAMKNAGYMSGVSQDLFSPDTPVIFEQALSVLVKLVGYNDVALATGGYPTGYLSVANNVGVLEGLQPYMGTPLSKGLLLDLIKNTVTCDMLVPNSYGTSNSYTTTEGVNILSYYHKIYEGTGIVNADAISTMSSERARVGYVVIDGVEYKKADDTILINTVGRKVNFFYKSQSGNKTVLFADVANIREATFVVGPKLDFSYTTGAYTYETEDKTLTYKIGYSYKVIYNMFELYPVTADRMLPDSGTITLIDNDEDGIYEIIIIDEFKNIVADNYNAASDRVIDILDPSRTIKFNDYEFYRVIDPVGAPYDKAAIEKYDVIEFYESIDGTSFTALVKRSAANVIIDGIDDNYIYCGNDKYFISADARENIATISLGGSYKIYLNSKNELVYWTRGDDIKVGYVIDVKGTTGLEPKTSVKIYTTTGQVNILPLADKVTNYTTFGTTVSTASLKKTDYATIFPGTNGSSYRELVAYKLNAQGEIAAVYHPMILDDLDTIKNPPPYTLYRLDYHNKVTLDIRNSSGKIVSPNTIVGNSLRNMILGAKNMSILLVPPVTSPVDDEALVTYGTMRDAFYQKNLINTDPTDFPTSIGSSFSYQGTNGQAVFYMLGSTYPYVSTIVHHAESTGTPVVDSGRNGLTVTDIRYLYDKETYEEKVIISGRNGTTKTITEYEITNPELLNRDNFINVLYGKTSTSGHRADKTKIEVGDCIYFGYDATGKISAIALIYDGKNKNYVVSDYDNYNYTGEVTYAGNGAIEYVDFATSERTVLDVSSISTWVFESEDKNRIGTYQDFEVGDIIYHRRYSTANDSITIYKPSWFAE